MKTIKQLSSELGISKQAIFKRVDALGCRLELEMVDGQYFVNDKLQEKIKNYPSTVNHQLSTDNRQPSTINRQPSTYNQQSNLMLINTINNQILEKNQQIEELKGIINKLQTELTNQKEEISNKDKEIAELKITAALYEKLKEDTESLKADKVDLQKHRDTLTKALTVSKSDLARLENIVTQLAAMPLRTRVFGWSGAVAQLTMVSGADEIFVEETLSENTENN